MNKEEQLRVWRAQAAALRARHSSNHEGAKWLFELETKIKILEKGIGKPHGCPVGWARYE